MINLQDATRIIPGGLTMENFRCPHCGEDLSQIVVAVLAANAGKAGKVGGKAKTAAKRKASAENGRKGGRPRKQQA